MGKILYVEDNMDTANAVRLILNSNGHNVELASTGKEGIDKLEKNDFDLVILDIMLPDMSGIDIFKKLDNKLRSKCAFLSILSIPQEQMTELKQKGAMGHIRKPFENDYLIKEINMMLDSCSCAKK